MKHYILIDRQVVEAESPEAWHEWFGTAKRRVAKTHLGDFVVSTTFFGLDLAISSTSAPLVFETMVFLDDEEFGRVQRYATWQQAADGHAKFVARVEQQCAELQMLTIDTLATIMVDFRREQ